MRKGTLHVIGVGPGDPELLTCKAARLLERLTVIAYPVLNNRSSFARRIIDSQCQLCERQKRELALPIPFTPVSERICAYDRAAQYLTIELTQGHDVGLLCEGDPSFYGSFHEIYERLRNEWPISVIPGIASPMACAAIAGQILAVHNQIFSVIPATLPNDIIEQALIKAHAAAIIKLGRHFSRIRYLLKQLGYTHHAHYIACAGLESEYSASLSKIDPTLKEAPYFSMILIRSQPLTHMG